MERCKRIRNAYGHSFCNRAVGDPVLSHTLKQEAIRESEIQGEQEAKSNERREMTECEVTHAACVADKGLSNPLQDCAGLWCSTHLYPRPITGP